MNDADAAHPRGLATVAMIKTNFDSGQDHIGMCAPFVLDSIRALPRDNFSLQEIRAAIEHRHGLIIPPPTLTTLLKRCIRENKVRKRDEHRYVLCVPRSKLPDISTSRTAIDTEHRWLGEALQQHLQAQSISVNSTDAALDLLLEFLAANEVTLLLAGIKSYSKSRSEASTLTRQELRGIASFIEAEAAADTEWIRMVERLLEGLVLQKALLLSDIGAATRKFENVQVFFDTRLLFQLLGLEGKATERAILEVVQALRGSGASVLAFDITIAEMRRILDVFVDHLATTSGQMSLYPTPLARHLITNRVPPSDVQMLSALLEQKLQRLGIAVREVPTHEKTWTREEATLAQLLKKPDEGEWEPRVVHDVSAVAAVLTLRRDRWSDSIEKCVALFCTTTTLVAQHVEEWWRANTEPGVSPVVLESALSNAAWLKRPRASPTMKVRQLVAACEAALRPSRHTWDAFLAHLKRLVESRELTSEEAVALVANSLTDRVLRDFDTDEGDLGPLTLAAAVERVRATYQLQAQQAEARARDAVERIEAAVRESQVAVSAITSEVASEVPPAHAFESADKTQLARLTRSIDARAVAIARIATKAVETLIVVSVVVVLIVGWPGLVVRGANVYFVSALYAIGISMSLYNVVWGVSVRRLARWVELRLAARVVGWLSGGVTTKGGGAGPNEL